MPTEMEQLDRIEAEDAQAAAEAQALQNQLAAHEAAEREFTRAQMRQCFAALEEDAAWRAQQPPPRPTLPAAPAVTRYDPESGLNVVHAGGRRYSESDYEITRDRS